MANLSANDIYSKEFNTSMKGYNTKEVDDFLDKIIEDYEGFENVIKQLRTKVMRLEDQLTQKQTSFKHGSDQEVPSSSDLLIRLSNLEKKVFGK